MPRSAPRRAAPQNLDVLDIGNSRRALAALIDHSPVVITASRELDAVAMYSDDKCIIEVNPKHGEHDVFKALCREVTLANYQRRQTASDFHLECGSDAGF